MQSMYEELSRAASVDDVVRVTSDYLAGWSRHELERLPDTCRPAWVRSAHDIEHWADRLAAESQQAMLVLEDERRLDRLTSHFLIASVRIRQLAGAQVPLHASS
jgi:hypothetical protein